MGETFAWGFPELVPYMYPVFEEAWRTGLAQDVVEAPMMVERNGYKEEAFFTGNFTPIRGMAGNVVGLYNALFEVTRQKIHERRTNVLNRLAAIPGGLTIGEVYSHVLTSLRENPNDIPMAILYEADAEPELEKLTLRLRGQFGIPENHGFLRGGHALDEEDDDVLSIYRQALSDRVITKVDGRFDGLEWLGFQQPSDHVVTVKLSTGVRFFGFLTIGTNPYRPFDDTCEQSVKDLTRMISSVIASAWDADDLRKKQQSLESELQFSDMKLRHLVQHAAVGMALARPDGRIIWANEKFLSLAEMDVKKAGVLENIYEMFLEDDQTRAHDVCAGLIESGSHSSAELRLKRSFIPPVGNPEPAHIQMLAFAYKEKDNTISSMVCITDISRLKWAEAWQSRLVEDARHAKLQQEQFIDMVSHEMRNPLSAIFHSAETVYHLLDNVRSEVDMDLVPLPIVEAMRESISAASTILDCATHQKRIIDDILTLGRLKSTLLSVVPSAVRPTEMVDTVLSMFEAELRSSEISVDVVADQSIGDLGISHLYLDPSRVTQILLNLLTNAIKFVKTEPLRSIEIRYSASSLPPQSLSNTIISKGVHWAPKGDEAVDPTSEPVWGGGEILYFICCVTDTGIGMHKTELDKVFKRFEQASIQTFVSYGGSGLGLYIAKKITERMGGGIGVSSQVGKGSCFVFYIKTRRAKLNDHVLPMRPAARISETLSVKATTNVLLVEDNLVNQQVLTKQLTRLHFHVTVANQGLEALKILQTPDIHFDVVLMDVQMPIMDGLTCTKAIRALEKTGALKRRLPIIAVTANVRQERIDEAMAAGVVSRHDP